ncbi:MAG: M28 family peptidase [Eubacterium sp.]|nr:M28 family peptidase [Eubacterium sp.]
MVKKMKGLRILGITMAMMMAVSGCGAAGSNDVTEAVTEAQSEAVTENRTEAVSESEAEKSTETDEEETEKDVYVDDELVEWDTEDPVSNEASKMIKNLSTPVTIENESEYDFTAKAMEYMNYIGENLKDRGRENIATNQHDATIEWIKSELKAAGFTEDQIVDQIGQKGGAPLNNIIVTVPGEDDSKQIIAGAHFDGDGVGDNGSGTALLLATAVGLQGKKPHYTTKYIFFDGEEEGMLGSEMNVSEMSEEDIANTIYMINMDAIAFGDYANIYGGLNNCNDDYLRDEDSDKIPPMTDAYYFAAKTAKALGFEVMGPEELDGYFAEHETGPEINNKTFYTNPWTAKNPAPINDWGYSPATIPASDHVFYMNSGIQYIYFEATNWFAASSKSDDLSYTGYLETYDESVGESGMFMNTKYDTLENLNELFPGRAEAHMHLYSPLLSALILAE